MQGRSLGKTHVLRRYTINPKKIIQFNMKRFRGPVVSGRWRHSLQNKTYYIVSHT